MQYPTVSPSIVLSTDENGYLAYDIEQNLLHELNPVAALLVELCDGQQSQEEICKLAAPYLKESNRDSTRQWFDQAYREGLLIANDAKVDDDAQVELNDEQLFELANDLRNEGKIRAAYLCQKQALELEPESSIYWRVFAELTYILGRQDETCRAYESYLELVPEDAEVQHLLRAIRDEAIPERVPNECIEKLYERFSGFYESNMRDELGYVGPENLWEVLSSWVGTREDLQTLDLGCGTGLSGEMIRPFASELIGIDLSPEMISLAGERKIYDHLEVAEIVEWLTNHHQTFDLILSCDAFIYFGDLKQILVPAAKRLNKDGALAFSVEKSDENGFQLTGSGRFVHHLNHINDIAGELGFKVNSREAFLRKEYGRDVTGLYVLLTRD